MGEFVRCIRVVYYRPIYTTQPLPKIDSCNLREYCVVLCQSSTQLASLSYMSCVLDLHSITQVVSRLHATVLGKSFVV